MRSILLVPAILLFVTGPREVFADGLESDRQPWAVTGHLGLLAPQGLVGLEVEYGLSEWLALSASAGIGLGVSLATMLRVRWSALDRKDRFFWGASLGPHFGSHTDLLPHNEGSSVRGGLWIAADGYLELRDDDGLIRRLYAGRKRLIHGECRYSEADHVCRGRFQIEWETYVGGAVGFAF